MNKTKEINEKYLNATNCRDLYFVVSVDQKYLLVVAYKDYNIPNISRLSTKTYYADFQ